MTWEEKREERVREDMQRGGGQEENNDTHTTHNTHTSQLNAFSIPSTILRTSSRSVSE
jgi:hypothetical protein